MVRVQKKCPKCGYVLQPYEVQNPYLNFAEVLTICPECKTILKTREKEYINCNIFTYILEIIKVLIMGICYGILVWGLLDLVILRMIITNNVYDNAYESNEGLHILLAIIITAIIVILHSYSCYNLYKEEKQKSINRLKNESYLNNMLIAKIITQRQYNKFKEKYYINNSEVQGNSKKYCTKCGKEINTDWDFCNYCGNKLK